jgi:beta-mannanase
MTAWQGRAGDVLSVYSGWRSNDARLSPIKNQDIVAGRYDGYLQVFATELKQFLTGGAAPRRVHIRLDWEGNGNWYAYSPTANASDCAGVLQQEQVFAAVWRHVHDAVTADGGFDSSEVAWVYSINAGSAGASRPRTSSLRIR